jgi:hypothetical protein
MKRLFALLCLALASLACSAPPEPLGATEQSIIKRSKVIQFPVTFFATVLAAHDAAESHRLALVAAGDAWATAGWPGAGPLDRLDATGAALHIGTFWGVVNGVEEPRVADPNGTTRANFTSTDYFAGP